jgi:hypothetical protein
MKMVKFSRILPTMDERVAVISSCIQDLPVAVFGFMYLQFLLENSTKSFTSDEGTALLAG